MTPFQAQPLPSLPADAGREAAAGFPPQSSWLPDPAGEPAAPNRWR